MKRIWPYVALGVVAYLVFATVTLPANVVVPRVQPPGVMLAGLDGTIWNGSAQALQIAGTHVGSVRWKLHLLPLLTLRPAATVDVRRTDGFARGVVSFSGSRVELGNVSAALPIGALPSQVVAPGWQGSINARFVSLTLADGWPIAADGTVEIADLIGPPRSAAKLGTFQATFPASDARTNVLTGALRDVDGQLHIDGTIELTAPTRTVVVRGFVATKPGAPAELTRALEILGPADAQGRRQFAFESSL